METAVDEAIAEEIASTPNFDSAALTAVTDAVEIAPAVTVLNQTVEVSQNTTEPTTTSETVTSVISQAPTTSKPTTASPTNAPTTAGPTSEPTERAITNNILN